MVQPPPRAAPAPISAPPPALRSIVAESGVRQRNSPESFAAAKEPIRMPSTSITDQSTRVTSPVARKVTIFAEGVVIPSPPLRPAAVDSTQAAIAIRPSSTPPTQRSEEHTSELQSRFDLVCRLLLEKKNECRGAGGRR